MSGWGLAKASGSAGSSRLGGEAAPRGNLGTVTRRELPRQTKLVTFVHQDGQTDLPPGSKEKQLHALGIQMLAT